MTDPTISFYASHHLAELFESAESLVDTVSTFLCEGLSQGDPALVVMRLAQWNSVAAKLTSCDVSLSDAISTGQLTVLDGARTLGRIMLHGAPCRGLFEEIIGKTVRQLSGPGGRLRIYSDLVDMLAEDGNFHGAHELEKMWADLVRREPVTVLCGYCASSFYGSDALDPLTALCCSHTNIRTASRLRVPPPVIPALDQRS